VRFEIEKRETRRFKTQRLRYWKPQSGEYIILIDLSKEPKIREQEFERGKKRFADFYIETVNDRKELERYLWSIPIAKTERVNGELVVYFWENSQRGEQIREIAERYGYQNHIVKVIVQRDERNPLNTQYQIIHSDNCPCTEKTEITETKEGRIEYTEQRIPESDVIELLRKRITEVSDQR